MKKLVTLLLGLMLMFAGLSLPVSAEEIDYDKVKKVKTEKVKNAEKIMLNAKDESEIRKQLEKSGWEILDDKDVTNEGSVDMLTLPGCGSLVIQPLSYSPETNEYMVRADWDFKNGTSDCDFMSGAGNVKDYLALGIVTNTGVAANQQAYSPGIVVKNHVGTTYTNYGGVNDYHNAGVSFNVADSYKTSFPPNLIGDNGRIYFFIKRPTNGTSYYTKGLWAHTWSSSSVSLSSVSITYPWSVTATFNNSSAVNEQRFADQELARF